MTLQKLILAAGLILAMMTLSFGHSAMKSTSPSDNEVLSANPEMIHLTFAAPARVMKVTMTHSMADISHEKQLEISTRELVNELHLSPDFMGPGKYLIEWRALGEDGHVLKGEFTFKVTEE